MNREVPPSPRTSTDRAILGGILSAGLVVGLLSGSIVAAQASVDISSEPTKNMSCSDGVCSPTAKDAVLNVTDLANMLASSDVRVTTGTSAVTIGVTAALSWTSSRRLTLSAGFNINIRAPVTVAGSGGVTLVHIPMSGGSASPAGEIRFFPGGKIAFWDLGSSLIINGKTYTLFRSIDDLEKALKTFPAGRFALAGDYDAEADGIYGNSPIREFDGTLEGLGNSISNLSVESPGRRLGLVGFIGENRGRIRDLWLTNVDVTGNGEDDEAGGLAGRNDALINYCHVTGTVSTVGQVAGGLVGYNYSVIENSNAGVAVTGPTAGGLVGVSDGTGGGGRLLNSFATGPVSGTNAGGLEGTQYFGYIVNSYATGAATGVYAGGLLGNHVAARVDASYSTGTASGSNLEGGFVGYFSSSVANYGYWDLDTSGVNDPSRGCGNVANCPGVMGLSDAQLRSALPAGFDPAIWGRKADFNGGYPYLLANPPPN